MMTWRAHPDYSQKTAALDPRFRPALEAFLDGLDRAALAFVLGDCRRTLAREWELWKVGRRCAAGANASDPSAWTVVDRHAVVTHVPPGSGKGPHFFGLAADVYPLDETHRIMPATHPAWPDTRQRMWDLAEQLGIDALGHRTAEPGDEYASYDPCHFQQLRWAEMVKNRAPVSPTVT